MSPFLKFVKYPGICERKTWPSPSDTAHNKNTTVGNCTVTNDEKQKLFGCQTL